MYKPSRSAVICIPVVDETIRNVLNNFCKLMTMPVQCKGSLRPTESSPNRQFTVINAHVRQTDKAQINNFMRNLKILEKQQNTRLKPKVKREIIKIRVEIGEIEATKISRKDQQIKEFVLSKDKPLTTLL